MGDLESLAGLCGLGLLFIQRRESARLYAGILLGYFPVFAFIATDPRYSYPIDPILLLLGAYFVSNIATNLVCRRQTNFRPNMDLDLPVLTGHKFAKPIIHYPCHSAK